MKVVIMEDGLLVALVYPDFEKRQLMVYPTQLWNLPWNPYVIKSIWNCPNMLKFPK